MRGWKALISLAALTAASPKAGDAPLITRAKAAIADLTRDPAAVQFRNVRLVAKGMLGKPVVCGEFNAKNGYGGYVGFEPFAYPAAMEEAHYPSEKGFMWGPYSEGC